MKKIKYRIKTINTYEDWEYCILLIKNHFFKNSNFNPYELNDLKGLFINDKLVGTIELTHINNKEVECNYFIIEDSIQGKGHGSILLEKIKKYLIYKKIEKMIFVSKKHLESFYLNQDFKITKKNTKYTFFEKELTSR